MEQFDLDTTEVRAISYPLENCEVARVESSLSVNRPGITFKRSKVYVNTELLKRVPEATYVQFLIDRTARKMILQPCDERERDAVLIRSLSKTSIKPRSITCSEFSRLLFEYMGWDMKCRYRAVGSIISSNGATLVVFDLSDADRFNLAAGTVAAPTETSLPHSSRFGTTVIEYLDNPLVKEFSEDTVISIEAHDNSANTRMLEVQQ